MELKVKQLERKIEELESKCCAQQKIIEEILVGFEVIREISENDSKEINKLLKIIDSRFTDTEVHDLNKKLSVL